MAKSLFHSCRSPSAADAVVTSTTTLLASGHPPVVPASAGQCCPRRLPRRRPQTPGACGAAGCDYATDDLPPARGTPAYRWLKSSQWHVIEAAGVTDDDHTPRLKIDARRRLRRSRRRHHRLHHRADPASGSSGDSGWFTSDEDSYANSCGGGGGEAETLVKSTTTESSSGTSGNCGGEADGAVVAGSFAVVKRSDEPRADFRRSMAEMVVGRAIYDADGLERLLRCFLALNHQRHRRDIVAAFGDVWEAVFSNPTSSQRSIVTPEPAICKAQRSIVTPEPAICKAAATVSNRR